MKSIRFIFLSNFVQVWSMMISLTLHCLIHPAVHPRLPLIWIWDRQGKQDNISQGSYKQGQHNHTNQSQHNNRQDKLSKIVASMGIRYAQTRIKTFLRRVTKAACKSRGKPVRYLQYMEPDHNVNQSTSSSESDESFDLKFSRDK